MALTLPVYVNCERISITPGATTEQPDDEDGGIKLRSDGDDASEANSPGIPRGLLVGVRATTGATAGSVTVRVYNDVDATDELYNVTLDLSASPYKSSDLLSQGIPFFSPPYFTIQCTADPGEAVFVTFYVKSIAGNA